MVSSKLAWNALVVLTLVACYRFFLSAGEVDPVPAALVSGKKISGAWEIAQPELEGEARRAGLPLSFSIDVRERSFPDVALSQGSLALPTGELWRGTCSLDGEEAGLMCVGRFDSGKGFRLRAFGAVTRVEEFGVWCDLWRPYFLFPRSRREMDRLYLTDTDSQLAVSYRRMKPEALR
ncbi:MAG: hypothetical protein AAF368_09920 [Planctomycetota bacterium]